MGEDAEANDPDDEAAPAARSSDRRDPTRQADRLSIAAAVLLGLATIASAWGAYQAARWSGVMTIAFNEGIQLNNDAGKAFQEGDGKYNLDQTLFVQWVLAIQQDDTETATYLQQTLFSEELTPAIEAWSSLGEDAPDSPFELDAYVIAEWDIGNELESEAEQKFTEAKDANQTSDNYVLITVVFASTLFFAGLAGTVKLLAAKAILLGIALVMFIGAGIAMLGQPIF